MDCQKGSCVGAYEEEESTSVMSSTFYVVGLVCSCLLHEFPGLSCGEQLHKATIGLDFCSRKLVESVDSFRFAFLLLCQEEFSSSVILLIIPLALGKASCSVCSYIRPCRFHGLSQPLHGQYDASSPHGCMPAAFTNNRCIQNNFGKSRLVFVILEPLWQGNNS